MGEAIGERSHEASAGSKVTLEEEERLVRAAAAGDEQAFAAIYQRFARGLFAYLLHRLRRREAAEDLVQEVFLALLRHGAGYRARAPLAAFLYRIARNRASNLWRDARPEEEARERGAPPPPYEDIVDVRLALERLPDAFREPILLATYEQLSYQEIAEVLGCPVGTVRSRISRGKRMMVAWLGGGNR